MAKAKLSGPPDTSAPSFSGFTVATIKFLHGLKKNNNKEWFEEHRDDYEFTLREPFKGLVSEMAVRFQQEKLPLIANPRTSLFRINRDIRFSKDKSPYKTHIGVWFPTTTAGKEDWSGVYFGIEPGAAKDVKVWCGGGSYQPQPPQLKRIRKNVSEDFKAFTKLLNDKSFRKHYPNGLEDGEKLKRIPQGFTDDDPAAEFLKLKNWYFNSAMTKQDILSDELPDILLDKFRVALPLTLFLNR